jgi:hypothetical protein
MPIDRNERNNGNQRNRCYVEKRCYARHSVRQHCHHGAGVLAVHVEQIESHHRGQGYR